MLAQARSERANAFQVVLGFWLIASGASKALFDVLSHAGLSVSYSTAVAKLKMLADDRIRQIRSLVKDRPFLINWDNLCLRYDVSEQREANKSRFISGTTASIIELFNIRLGELKSSMLAPRIYRQPTLRFKTQDIFLSLQQTKELSAALISQIIGILFQYYPSLKTRFPDALKPPVIQCIPIHRTEHHSLPYLCIDESSVDGTIKIIESIICTILQMTPEDLKRHGIIICSGDLLTWSLTDKVYHQHYMHVIVSNIIFKGMRYS